MSKFLSEEWAAEVTAALGQHPGFKNAIGSAELGIQFEVSDGPEGDAEYYLKSSGGNSTMAVGTLESPDVTVRQTYDTATAISKGELNTQTAFMTGKVKVSGNLAKLMMHQSAIQQWNLATVDLDVEY
ncbi:MAG TPA: SCP2 sterol-binding domain-containing protein [Acidimicrobiia bacterium]